MLIRAVNKVILPVEDQNHAKEFWTQRIGFEATRDETYGDERWIEVTPPGGGPVLVLSPRPPGQPRTEVPETLPHSPVFFTCDDIERPSRADRARRGVRRAAATDALRLVVDVHRPRRYALRARTRGRDVIG
jgi:hypothetical protein